MKSLFLVFSVFLLVSSCTQKPPRTSADASAADVQFLSLPESASEIRFWDDGHNNIVSFKISEAEFRGLFNSVPFSEITEPMYYFREGFGNPEMIPINNPDFDRIETSNGIYYEKIEADGGGPTIVYDRNKGVGSFEFAPW